MRREKVGKSGGRKPMNHPQTPTCRKIKVRQRSHLQAHRERPLYLNQRCEKNVRDSLQITLSKP